jgi:hypothetical protein
VQQAAAGPALTFPAFIPPATPALVNKRGIVVAQRRRPISPENIEMP